MADGTMFGVVRDAQDDLGGVIKPGRNGNAGSVRPNGPISRLI